MYAIRSYYDGLEVAEILVGAPVLGELDAGAGELAGRGFELGLKPFEQGEGIGGRSREPRHDLIRITSYNVCYTKLLR